MKTGFATAKLAVATDPERPDAVPKTRKPYQMKAYALFNKGKLLVSEDDDAIFWWVSNSKEKLQSILDGDLSDKHLADLRTADIRQIEIREIA